MKKTVLFAVVAILMGLSSCSEYNKVVKSDDYERKLELADEYYKKGSQPKIVREGKKNEKRKVRKSVILRSIGLYEQIYERMPKTAEGELAYFRIGKAYYTAGDYYMAGYYLGNFSKRFPYSKKAEESLFLSAMCSVNNSPVSTLDQTETELAINDLQQFIDRYPKSEFVDSCNNIIDGLRFKLETKSYNDVKLYSKTGNYNSAVTTALTFIEDYPVSQFVEEIQYVLILNSFKLAENSVEKKKERRITESIERYDTFVVQFPESKYIKSLDGTYEAMKKELEEIRNN